MADPLLEIYTSTLPTELQAQVSTHLTSLSHGQFKSVLDTRASALLLGWRDNETTSPLTLPEAQPWTEWLSRRLSALTDPSHPDVDATTHTLFLTAIAALQAFVQSNVTGPPLSFRPSDALWPDWLRNSRSVADERTRIVDSLAVDGIAAYKLTPNIELFALAQTILSNDTIRAIPASALVNLRADVFHQRLLGEVSSSLQESIYSHLSAVEALVQSKFAWRAHFLVERAAVHTLHGLDKRAREDLEAARRLRGFEFALTGKLGKRTKWQDRDISQLVVLARSREESESASNGDNEDQKDQDNEHAGPKKLDLNDDTLLEAISFTNTATSSTSVQTDATLPASLASLDPSAQPRLHPLDSTLLLTLASSITNTSPADGLTREETLPYATRVLEGGSANWQVYTHALLLRSRIEGYKARTTERGLLQLQALVDQVIADTLPETPTGLTPAVEKSETSTFLPRPKAADAAPASARLAYVYALSSPTRRELEAELAQRWAALGGLRSALDIYARLEMWAEAALCWAATDREDRARRVLRRQLNHPHGGPRTEFDEDTEEWDGPPRDPAPADAPRLYCILGDIDSDPEMYAKAWAVSDQRYARAQRSLGRLFWQQRDYVRAADAYTLALQVNATQRAAWFALGCCVLELSEFARAVEAFARAVQLDESDAEAWSNLGVALIKRGPRGGSAVREVNPRLDDDGEPAATEPAPGKDDPQIHLRDALRALLRAATLKQDSAKIWDNVLTIAASLSPPSIPDILTAQSALITLTAKTAGESAIDVPILERTVRHVVATYPSALDLASLARDTNGIPSHRPGSVPARTVALVNGQVAPLITRSARLWRVVATLALWQDKPSTALDAHEKAWRAATGPGAPEWEGGEGGWSTIVDETCALCEAYESLGGRVRTEGLGAGRGEVVMRDWKFKARSAARGVLGRGKEFEGGADYERLRETLEGLKT